MVDNIVNAWKPLFFLVPSAHSRSRCVFVRFCCSFEVREKLHHPATTWRSYGRGVLVGLGALAALALKFAKGT